MLKAKPASSHELIVRQSREVDRLLEEFLVDELMATIREITRLRREKSRLVKRLENIRKRGLKHAKLSV